MRIVHVTHRAWPVVGGSERHVMAFARRQAAEGHAVTVVATQADALSALWSSRGRLLDGAQPAMYAGVDIVRLDLRHLPMGAVSFPALRRLMWLLSRISPTLALPLTRFVPWLPDLRRTLTDLRADLLVAWNLTLEGLTAAVAETARRQGAPWIALPLLHLARPRFYTMPHQLGMLASAAHVLPQTRLERDFLAARGLDPDRLTVLGPGVDPEDAAGADGARWRARLGLEGRPVALTLGRLAYDKGTLHLLRAARRLWEEGLDLALALVGAPDPAVRRAVRRLPPDQRAHCHLPGRVSEAAKWDALAGADVVALPSRTESFGIVFLEGWLVKKPVIGARAGAVAEVIEEGRDGLLVNFGDVVGLADGIRSLAASPDRAAAMGARGYAKVIDRYTWDAQYARFRDVVNDVVS